MTAPAITEETAAITRAHTILALVESLLDTQDCGCVLKAAEALKDRLEDYDLIESGDLHPAAEFPDLMYGHPHDALDAALKRITVEVGDLARELADEVWEHTEQRIEDGAAVNTNRRQAA